MNQAKYFMEHLEELLTGGSNPLVNGAMFGLLFDERPNYQELLNGTPKLSPLFKLNNTFVSSKEEFVTRLGLEPRTPRLKGECSTIELSGHKTNTRGVFYSK